MGDKRAKAEATLKAHQKKMNGLVKDYQTTFTSVHGREVLEDLKNNFDPAVICRTNADTTVMRAAQRDVIRYIEDKINGEVKEDVIET